MLWEASYIEIANKIIDVKYMPRDWKTSKVDPIYKKSSYRGVKLLEHSTKVWNCWRRG